MSMDGSIVVLPSYNADTEALIRTFNAINGVEISMYRTHTSRKHDLAAIFKEIDKARKSFNRKQKSHHYHIKTQHRDTLVELIKVYLSLEEGVERKYAQLASSVSGVDDQGNKVTWYRMQLNLACFFAEQQYSTNRMIDTHVDHWEATGLIRRHNVKSGRIRRSRELSSEIWIHGNCLVQHSR